MMNLSRGNALCEHVWHFVILLRFLQIKHNRGLTHACVKCQIFLLLSIKERAKQMCLKIASSSRATGVFSPRLLFLLFSQFFYIYLNHNNRHELRAPLLLDVLQALASLFQPLQKSEDKTYLCGLFSYKFRKKIFYKDIVGGICL